MNKAPFNDVFRSGKPLQDLVESDSGGSYIEIDCWLDKGKDGMGCLLWFVNEMPDGSVVTWCVN